LKKPRGRKKKPRKIGKGDEQMKEKTGFNQAEYVRDYNERNYDRIELKIPKGKKAIWKEKARKAGMSLTEYISKKMEEA